jgi:hypothetical protein
MTNTNFHEVNVCHISEPSFTNPNNLGRRPYLYHLGVHANSPHGFSLLDLSGYLILEDETKNITKNAMSTRLLFNFNFSCELFGTISIPEISIPNLQELIKSGKRELHAILGTNVVTIPKIPAVYIYYKDSKTYEICTFNRMTHMLNSYCSQSSSVSNVHGDTIENVDVDMEKDVKFSSSSSSEDIEEECWTSANEYIPEKSEILVGVSLSIL